MSAAELPEMVSGAPSSQIATTSQEIHDPALLDARIVDLKKSSPSISVAARPKREFINRDPQAAKAGDSTSFAHEDQLTRHGIAVLHGGVEAIGFDEEPDSPGAQRWIATRFMQTGASILVIADSPRVGNLARDFMISAFAGAACCPWLNVDIPTFQLVPAFERMGLAERTDFAHRVPTIETTSRVIKKNYASRAHPSLSLSGAHLASTIIADIKSLCDEQRESPRQQIVHLRMQDADALPVSIAGVSRLMTDLNSASVPSGACLVTVGNIETANFPSGMFDTVLAARNYQHEHAADSFCLQILQSKFVGAHEFPAQVLSWTFADRAWLAEPFFADDQDLRDMAHRAIKGESLASIGESYGIPKGSISRLLKPLRERGLMKDKV